MTNESPNRREWLFGAGAALLCLVAPNAHAASVIAADLPELARESHALVLAVVGAQTPIETPRGLYTDSVLTVRTVLGGDAPRTLTVRQLGGQRDGLVQRVAGDARIAEGDRIVAFVRRVGGQWYFTALAQSVWHVDGDGAAAPIRRDLDDIGLYRRDRSGRVRPTDESLPTYDTLDQLVAASRGLVFGDAP